jgi:hypothetical protein
VTSDPAPSYSVMMHSSTEIVSGDALIPLIPFTVKSTTPVSNLF